MRLKSLTWYLLPVGVLLLLAGAVQAHGQLPYPDAHWPYDHYRYVALAAHPFGSADPLAREPPFLWRILTPLLIHLLPVPLTTGFWLVTLLGLMGTTLAMEWILAGFALSRGAILAGGLAFVFLGPATGFLLWDRLLVDPLALCLLALVVGSTIHGHGRLLLVLVVLGALAKEATLLGALFASAWAWRQQRSLFPWSVAAVLAGGAVLVVLHLLLPASRSYTFLSAFEDASGFYDFSLGNFLVLLKFEGARLVEATLGAWGILLPLALLQVRHPPRFWYSYPAFLVLLAEATAQIFFATDLERLVVYGFPAIIVACCCEVEYLTARWGCSRWLFWVPILLVEGYEWLPYAGWSPPIQIPLAKAEALPAKLEVFSIPYRLVAVVVLVACASILVWLILTRKASTERLQVHPSDD